MAQAPVVKNNIAKFMAGETLNAVYDGYSYQTLVLAHSQMIGFSHYWDFEPTATNHAIPSHGMFSRLYHWNYLSGNAKAQKKFMSVDKNHGPPHYRYNKEWDPIESNEYLQRRAVDVEALNNIHKSGKDVSTA
jgi:hypothetical protein